MMLIFPNGERSRVSLGYGVFRVGAALNNMIVLRNSSMPLLAGEVRRDASGSTFTPYRGVYASLNGIMIHSAVSISVGDRINIAGVDMAVANAWSDESKEMMENSRIEGNSSIDAFTYLLKAINGAGAGNVYPIAGAAVVGRSWDCNIVLSQPDISRQHARLRPTIDGVIIEDMDSTNGVFFSGVRVQKQLLSPGDRFRLGRHFFLLCTNELRGAACGVRER